MKLSKGTKVFALLMTVVLLFSNSFVYSEAGKCTHGGKDFSLENDVNVSDVVIDCTEALPHPIYVMGQLALCRVWHYKYLRTYSCEVCKATLKQEFIYDNEIHEYEHK